MNGLEFFFKILELITTASIPILIAFWGFKLSKKIEDVKNKSVNKYYWKTQWVNLLFEKHREFSIEVISLLTNLEFLRNSINETTQDSEDKILLQKEINKSTKIVFKLCNELVLHSNTLFTEKNEIEESVSRIYSYIVNVINGKGGELKVINDELVNLNKITEKLTKELF